MGKLAGIFATTRKPDSQAAAKCHAQTEGVGQSWEPICHPPVLPILLTP